MAKNEPMIMPMDALQDAIRAKKTPLALTIAPSLSYIPPFLLTKNRESTDNETAAVAGAYYDFCLAIMEKAADVVPAVIFRPSAFEAIGWRGNEVMHRLMVKARELGCYIISDAVKSDVSDHTGFVKSAYLGSSELETYPCHSVTLNGYVGSDGIKPYIDYCIVNNKTVFVVVKSANPSTREFQELISGDRYTYTVIGDLCQRHAKKSVGKWGFSVVGAVFGPAYSKNMAEIRKRYPDTFFLIPEFGGQGGKIFDVAAAFNKYGHGALVACQADLPGAWQKYGKDQHDFADIAMDEINRMKADIRSMVQVL